MPIFLQTLLSNIASALGNVSIPLAIFLPSIALGAIIFYCAAAWRYKAILESLKEQVTLTEQRMDRQVDGLKQQVAHREQQVSLTEQRSVGVVETLKQQLAHKDQIIEGLKERVEMIPAYGSHLNSLSHEELKNSTLQFVKNLRDWLATHTGEDMVRHHQDAVRSQREARNAQDQWLNMNDEQRKEHDERLRTQTWDAGNSDTIRIMARRQHEFDTKFKGKAILFRDALLERTPRHETSGYHVRMYTHSSNSRVMEMIAEDLEGMAYLLK